MTKFIPFYYDTKFFFQNDKSFMITGSHIAFLTAFLNSSLFKFCFLDNFPELQGGTRELRKIFFDKIPVLKVTDEIDNHFADLISKLQREYSEAMAKEVDQAIFDLYGLSKDECRAIGFVEIR